MSHFSISASELASKIAIKAVLKRPNKIIEHLLTDSRKITDAKSSVFFVLKGAKNAHQYIPELYNIGVSTFILTDLNFDISEFPNGNFIWVADTTISMQEIIAEHRKQFHYPVIGITGSNGKTIVKEWLYQLLAPDYDIVRNQKSYNSQIGVPLAVWQMSDDYTLGIFEAGISTIGEMTSLERIIQPNIGILTNIGAAHDEGFANRTEKLQEKLLLFQHVDFLIINKEYAGDSLLKGKNLFTWSMMQPADLQVIKVVDEGEQSEIFAVYQGQSISITIPFTSKVSVENAIICWATMLNMGIAQGVIASRMEKLLSVKMRLELKAGINQSVIIDDSYNSDLSSVDIAIDFLNQQNYHPKKTLILSDIHQSGIPSAELYERVAGLINNKGVDQFIGIGKKLQKYEALFPVGSLFFASTDEFLNQFDVGAIRDETVLLKGSRDFEFERISKVLTQKVHDTVLEINLNAILHNLKHYKTKLKPGVKLMAMVKAFAYGSGSDEIANLLQHHRVDYLAVAYTDEGVALRQAGIKIPIMVLSPDVSSFEAILEHRLEPELYSFRILEAFGIFLKTQNVTDYPVHLKLDTGMHRLGFMSDEMSNLLESLQRFPNLKVTSVFSHLVASDSETHNDFTKKQIAEFEVTTGILEAALNYQFMRHICNTSGITKWSEAQFDMVRLGIGLYGIESVEEEKQALSDVVSLKTTISQIKNLASGDTVGYGRSGVMLSDGKIATVKIGYADGYPRALGNGNGFMLINGQRVPTIGNICMDMTMLNVTGMDVADGDDVVVFGEGLSVYEIAQQLKTIPYEVITNISQRVKRIYFYE